jgi:YHS domain-containing protein
MCSSMKKNLLRFLAVQPTLIVSVLVAMLAMGSACNQKPNTEMTSAPISLTDSTKPKITAAMVDNKKDPSCGMPVTAGIEDTVHYNGKVYGFCSEECKNAFLKNPVAMVKNAELK